MITIRDIAKQMGLSVSTVSRALNDNPRISQKTRDQVHEFANKAGYQPNYNARNLTNKEANSVGVVFPVNNRVVDNIFYVNLLRGINNQLSKKNYVLSVAIGDTTETVIENVTSMIKRGQVKKFILLYSHLNDPIIRLLEKSPVDFVTVGKPTHGDSWMYVDNDNVKAGYDGTKFLIDELGCQHPVFVESTNGWPYEVDRLTGYLTMVDEAGLRPVILSSSETDNTETIEFIHEHDEIDGVLATDDYTGLRFYSEYRRQRPGREVEVVGYNASLPRELTNEHFHSVDLNPKEMGRSAARILFANETKQLTGEQRHNIIAHEIMV
ncbi:LacI family DNA-binding transcriptional regulator [Lentilactobacillus sp. Marseille-Q4993]|uniref:LacI family DNA-binding transcriptional regulator n=1 Tax=Lentilactobacillus sp. Marseille-Q4993 TaxID=3039492 RepID=UPI0024BBF80D|nr:LacI family DNA-binding transcriptional regulator [Lentilactobacillus sp. Marseille-Q4993]